MTVTSTLQQDERRLTRDPQFLKYWAARVSTDFDASIAGLAISLTAVVALSANALEMGVLAAARNLPYFGVGLLAGVLVDRGHRRPIIQAAALASAALVLLVPLAATLGVLRVELLYLVAFGTGLMSVTAAVAYGSLLPVLVGRHRLIEANSLLQVSASTAQIGGPGLGGIVIQLVTAPVALLVSAAASIMSALLIARVKVDELTPVPEQGRTTIARDIREGLRLVLTDSVLRPIVLTGATHNFFSNGMIHAVYVLFASSRLGLTPAEIGLVFAAGGPGSFLGAILAARCGRIFGVGRTLGTVQLITGVARLAIPCAAAVESPILLLAVGELLLGTSRPVFNVHQLSLRQSLVPDHQMGRTTASIGFIMWGVVPIGALLGGWLGSTIGLIPTLAIGVIGTFAAALGIFLSSVRSLHTAPDR